jgi:hypothetical protein
MADSFIARERGILSTRKPSTVDLYELRLAADRAEVALSVTSGTSCRSSARSRPTT